jgi:ribonuclease HI
MSRKKRLLAEEISNKLVSHVRSILNHNPPININDIKTREILKQEWKDAIYRMISDENDTEETFLGYFDGSSIPNPGEMQCGYIVTDLNKKMVLKGSKKLGHGTNNVAEYNGLIMLLEKCLDNEILKLTVMGDSQLIIKQMNKEYKVTNSGLIKLWNKAQALSLLFKSITFKHVPRKENKLADQLTRI